MMVLRFNKCLKLAESMVSLHPPGCSGRAPICIPFCSVYSTPAVPSTVPEKTAFSGPEFSCRKKFTSDSWRLKHNKVHPPEHLHVECQKNVTIHSAPRCIELAQAAESNANKESIEAWDAFPYLPPVENVADSKSQPPPPPLPPMDIYHSPGAPLSDYIAESSELDAQCCLERNR